MIHDPAGGLWVVGSFFFFFLGWLAGGLLVLFLLVRGGKISFFFFPSYENGPENSPSSPLPTIRKVPPSTSPKIPPPKCLVMGLLFPQNLIRLFFFLCNGERLV